MAYKVAENDVESVKTHLDYREINGYQVFSTTVYPIGVEALIYVAMPDNVSFLGPDSLGKMAEHISRCKGKSGRNCDYLYGLRESLKIISGIEDVHVEELFVAMDELVVVKPDPSIHGAPDFLHLEELRFNKSE